MKPIVKLAISGISAAMLIYAIPYIAGYQYTRGVEDAKFHREIGGNGNFVQRWSRIFMGA